MTTASLGVPQISAELTAEKKSVSQKVIEAVKNNRGKIAFVGGGLLMAAAVALYEVYGNKCYIEEYINGLDTSDLNVSADDWFKKLGGITEPYTEEYKKCLKLMKYEERYKEDVSKLNRGNDNGNYINEKEIEQIEKDITRLGDLVDDTWDDTTKKDFTQRVGHILKFWVYKNKKSYIQGMSDYAAMVLRKFYECQNDDDYDAKEAKASYVYDKIMEVIEPNYFWWNKSNALTYPKQLIERIEKVLPVVECTQFKKICDYIENYNNMPAGAVLFNILVSFGLRCLEVSQVIKMWDRIIFDEEITTSSGFDSEKLLDMINTFNGKLIIFMFNNRGSNLCEKVLKKSHKETLFNELYDKFPKV